MADETERLSRHFGRDELTCKGKSCCNYSLLIHPDLIIVLELIWHYVNAHIPEGMLPHAIFVISGYRCPSHNIYVGGQPNSYHTQGKAADLAAGGMPKHRLAAKVRELAESGIFPFRVGFYHREDRGGRKYTVLHVDVGDGPRVFGDAWRPV